MRSSYKPFLISEFKTGLYNYLQPWIRPNEAFDPLENACIYRGCLNKRKGYSLLGEMAYRDNGISIETGDGGTSYSGTLSVTPIVPGSLYVTDGVESFQDNGDGTLTGSNGGSGTINYSTGEWALLFSATVTLGVVIRAGYTYYPRTASTVLDEPIMAIKTFIDESNDSKKLVVCNTKRAAVYNANTNSFDPLYEVSQIIWTGDGTNTSFTSTSGWINLAPYSISVTDGTSTIVDDGVGGLSASGNFDSGGTVDYISGVITLNFTAAPATTVNITLICDLSGDYFSGDFSNFFNATNWKPTTTATAYLYLTNTVDRVTLFDGSNLSRPAFPITQANKISYTNDIATCLDVSVYKNRLLLVRPKMVGNSFPDGQSIRWSALFNPTNTVADVTGNGGELSAPTSDWIQSDKFLRDTLICNFQNTAWSFKYTGSDFSPFRFDKLNSSKSCNAPYASIEYDERITAAGNKGLIACDGVNVQRYDIPIIDQFLDINQDWFELCFAEKLDTINQTWMLYPSNSSDTDRSDKALVYNFLENTWSIYDIPLSCLGLFYASSDACFNDFAVGGKYYNPETGSTWESSDFPWNEYAYQSLSPVMLGGTHDGRVVTLDTNTTDIDQPITATVLSTRWNPFVGLGSRTTFGYIDIYYEINRDCTFQIDFFVGNSSAVAAIRTLTLDGGTNDDFSWKRIYVNLTGEFIRMKMTTSSKADFKITGMILWAEPSGRLTPGATV